MPDSAFSRIASCDIFYLVLIAWRAPSETMENKAPTTADKEAAKQLAEEEQALNLMMQRLKLLHIKARLIHLRIRV